MNLALHAADLARVDEATPCEWSPPPGVPVIERGAVHLWRVNLAALAASLPRLRALLSPEELAKAERYRLAEDGERSLLARGTLRQILSRYANIDPARLRFCGNTAGKPALQPSSGGDRLRFNLSHKGTLMLCAVCADHEVGVDVEQLERVRGCANIAGLFFTPQERRSLQQEPEARQQTAFLRCWTRKEARLKALGEGLAMTWNGEREEETPSSLEACTTKSLCPARGYIAAVATVGAMAALETWDWLQR